MSNVLQQIVADKAQEIAALEASLPLENFIDNLQPSDRSLYQALSSPKADFILECKKASPSKGLIRARFDLDEIIHAYAPYAAAISVLTDRAYFQGEFDYLPYVRQRVSQPVLNKDFFISPYQVHLARYYQADAILLMLSVLDDQQYQALAKLAAHYQLDVLTEVSNIQEAERALALNASIIGINNRNLRDLSTNLATTEQLVPLLRDGGHQGLIISESGIHQHQQVRRLAPLVDGFLVGSALMTQADLPRAVKTLLHGQLKVCGLTQIDNARQVADSAASLGGLIFTPQSKRAISLEHAMQLVEQAPFNYVGVFVNAPVAQVADYAKQLALVAVQLHGNEDDAYRKALRTQLNQQGLADCQIWQALGVSEQLPDLTLAEADYILLDCQLGERSGGTGQAFNWQLLDAVADKSRLLLAGGLSPDNIQQASELGMAGLDVNSGIESAPGLKDPTKLKQVIAQLRA